MNTSRWSPSVLAVIVRRRAVRTRWRRLLLDPRGAARPRGFADAVRRRIGATGRRARVAGAAAAAATVGVVLAGPVAGVLLAGYAVVAVEAYARRQTRLAHARSRRFAVDAVAALAAELRAGLSVSVALAAAAGSLEGPAVQGPGAAAVARRVAESVHLADSSGAPLADVLDRLDAHLRAVDRARASAAAQAAGARASACLLAAMPVAGVGIGFVIGTDPLRVLLHTPLGAICLTGAAILQLAGLAWAARLSAIEVPT
jgi:tight adherence protein B